MGVKRLGLLGVIFLMGLGAFAQTDSTDLDFNSTVFVPATAQDSAQYGVNDYHYLTLEFDLVGEDVSSVLIEVIRLDADGNSTSVYYQTFTIAELEAQNLIDNADHVELALGLYSSHPHYQVFLNLSDTLGHEKISLSKYLVE